MSGSYVWKPKRRFYKTETHPSISTLVFTHPLKSSSVQHTGLSSKKGHREVSRQSSGSSTTSSQSSKKKQELSTLKNHATEPEFIDPLGAALENTGLMLDPLQNATNNNIHFSKKSALDLDGPLANSLETSDEIRDSLTAHTPGDPELPGFTPWTVRRQKILSQYTTNEKLAIVTSFLPGGHPLESHVAVTDKTKHRLEQLDQFDERNPLRRMPDLTQQDYISRINELNSKLRQAWREDQRVHSVQIVIQCAKLLADCTVPEFYPSQFVLVTDILDTFGRLVFERLWTKANSELKAANKPGLTPNFEADQVPETTKETVRNWFFKIASVRELLPRFYVELSILKCMKFLHPTSAFFTRDLRRLANMARGIGNPLFAAYARCYLCRIGMTLCPLNKEYLWLSLHDWLKIWPNYLENIKKDHEQSVIRLFWPSMEWILQCLTYNAAEEDLLPLWEYCKQSSQQNLLLSPILNAFPPRYIAENGIEVAKILLGTVDSNKERTGCLLRSFGQALLVAEPSPVIQRTLLREVWKAIMRFQSVEDYMNCAEVWLEFACRHFGTREVNTLLEDIIRHVNPDKSYEKFYPQILGMLEKIVTNMKNFQTVFAMERFVAFLDLFQKDSVRVQACHLLLDCFGRYQIGETDDLGLSNHVTMLCKSLHDSLNALSLEDERRETVLLICRSLDKFRFEKDAEQELTFLVEARGSFSNLDAVIEHLVRRANSLIVRTREKMDGRHTRRTAHFVRACVAYAYITIPSIVDHFTRMKLYTESASVALINNCLPQGDALLKAAISLIPEIPVWVTVGTNRKKSTEPQLVDAINNLLSLLLVVPDPPEQGQPLYLMNGLLTAVQRYPWPESSDGKVGILVKMLAWLSAAAQPDYLYHIEALESNDTLYGGSEDFLKTVQETSNRVLNMVLETLKELAKSQEYKRQSTVALDLLDTLLHVGDLQDEGMRILAGNLWNLAQKYGGVDRNRIRNIGMFVRARAEDGLKNFDVETWKNLAAKMRL